MCVYADVLVHRWEWCCLVECRYTHPRSMSYQHLWAHFPAPCHAPSLGVTPPASPECSTPQTWGLVVGWPVSCLPVVVVGDMGVGHLRVRHYCCVRWPLTGSSCWSPLVSWSGNTCVFDVVVVLDGCHLGRLAGLPPPPAPASPHRLRRGVLRHKHGAYCSVVVASTCLWTTSVTWVWAFRVFDVVVVPAGRGLGRSAAYPWPSPVLVAQAS